MSNVLKLTMIGVGVVLILLAKLISIGERIDELEKKLNSLSYTSHPLSYVDTNYEDEIADDKLIKAIMEVESNGNPNAYNETIRGYRLYADHAYYGK
jgi:hypothetical protein